MAANANTEFTVLSRGSGPEGGWQFEAVALGLEDAREVAKFAERAGREASIAGPLRPCPRHPLCYRVRVGREVVHFGPGADI
jgi:hypothetical protein